MSLLKSGGWLLAQFAGERVVSGLTVILLARIMGPEAFGYSALAVAVPAVFIASARALVDTVMAAASEEADRLDGIFVFSMIVGCTATPIALLLTTILHHLVAPDSSIFMWWLAALIPMVSMTGAVPEGLINARRHFHLAAVRKLAAALAGAGVSIYLATTEHALFAMPSFLVTQAVIGLILAFVMARWRPLRLRLSLLRGAAGADGKLGLSILTTNLCSQALPRLTEILSGVLLGPAAAGAVRISLQLVETVSGIFYSISDNLILSRSATFRSLDAEGRATAVQSIIEAVCVLFSGFFMFLCLFHAEIFYILLGSGWLPYSYVMAALSLIGLFGAVEFTIRAFQKALFLRREIYIATLASTLLNSSVMLAGAFLFRDYIYLLYVVCSFLNLAIAYYVVRAVIPLTVAAILRATIWPLGCFGAIMGYGLFLHGDRVPVPFSDVIQNFIVFTIVMAVLFLVGWKRLDWRLLRSAQQ